MWVVGWGGERANVREHERNSSNDRAEAKVVHAEERDPSVRSGEGGKEREGGRERESGRLHKDRSWRVPGASLHTMHLC